MSGTSTRNTNNSIGTTHQGAEANRPVACAGIDRRRVWEGPAYLARHRWLHAATGVKEHFARGQVAVASGDAAGARAHFDQCVRTNEWCKSEGVLAAEKAGDKADAAAARDALLKLYQRNAMHLIVRSRLTQPTS